jgi:hypothetical protein
MISISLDDLDKSLKVRSRLVSTVKTPRLTFKFKIKIHKIQKQVNSYIGIF